MAYPSFDFAADGAGYIGSPIECIRLMREGWEIRPGKSHRQKRDSPAWEKFDPPLTFCRRQPGNSNVILSWFTTALFVRNGPSAQRRAEIGNQSGRVLRRFDAADWAEFSHKGDLLISTGGCLHRLPARHIARASDDPWRMRNLSPIFVRSPFVSA